MKFINQNTKKIIIICFFIVILAVLVFVLKPFFITGEGNQAIVTRYGKIVGTYTEAGLHFKIPLIDTVIVFPKKIQSLDGDPQKIPTKEKQYIVVDTTARWRITDPKLFYETMQNVNTASVKIGNIIDSTTRTVITENNLIEVVRSSNVINEIEAAYETSAFSENKKEYEVIEKGRKVLSEEMVNLAKEPLRDFGIELIDIVTRQIKYSDDLTESVYQRMIKERNQIANAIRSTGEGEKANLLGKLESDKKIIMSEAYEEAEIIKAEGDREASRIYSEAYKKDPEFYKFWKSLESYKTTLPEFNKTLGTDMEYFDYLYSATGQ